MDLIVIFFILIIATILMSNSLSSATIIMSLIANCLAIYLYLHKLPKTINASSSANSEPVTMEPLDNKVGDVSATFDTGDSEALKHYTRAYDEYNAVKYGLYCSTGQQPCGRASWDGDYEKPLFPDTNRHIDSDGTAGTRIEKTEKLCSGCGTIYQKTIYDDQPAGDRLPQVRCRGDNDLYAHDNYYTNQPRVCNKPSSIEGFTNMATNTHPTDYEKLQICNSQNCYEPNNAIAMNSVVETALSVDEQLARLAVARTRDKKAMDGATVRDARYYAYHYDDELELYEKKRWWGNDEV